MGRLGERVKFLENELEKERVTKATMAAESGKLISENKRLNEMVERFQAHIMKTQEDESHKYKSRHTFSP